MFRIERPSRDDRAAERIPNASDRASAFRGGENGSRTESEVGRKDPGPSDPSSRAAPRGDGLRERGLLFCCLRRRA